MEGDNDELMTKILNALFASAVSRGEVELTGDLEHDMVTFFEDYLAGTDSGEQLRVSIDYAPSILDEARRYHREGKHHFATVFYAMWMEHWANGLISTGTSRFRGSERLASQLMKKFSITEKLELAWELFGWGNCADAIDLKALTQISDARNYLVHYKYGEFPIDGEPNDPFEKACQKAEIEVPRMIEIENALLYAGRRAEFAAHLRDGVDLRRAAEAQEGSDVGLGLGPEQD